MSANTVLYGYYKSEIENCPRLRIEVRPTVLGFGVRGWGLDLQVGVRGSTLTSDFDLQSQESYVRNLYTSKKSRSIVT